MVKERQTLLRRLHMLDHALHALNGRHWKMSAEGRRKISRARKEWWAAKKRKRAYTRKWWAEHKINKKTA